MDFAHIRNYLFIGLLTLVTVVFLFMLRPFAYPIFWAAVLAALFYPFFKWLNKHLKHPNLSAVVTLVATAIIIILPMAIIGSLLIRETISLYSTINNNSGQLAETIQRVGEAIKNNHYTKQFSINESFWIEKSSEVGKFVIDYLFSALSNITQNSLLFLAMFILMLYSFFFFVRDGETILKKLMYLCPLGDKNEIMLYHKFTAAASAMIKGTVIVGGIQGILGGIVFWLAGIHGAVIWGVIMTIASLIPTIGTSIVWLPAAIIMILAGHVWQGIMILLVGLLLVSTIDNVLRPILVGKNMHMPALLVLFSTLGGIALFGFTGLLLGPIITALFLAFWEMYEENYRQELKKN